MPRLKMTEEKIKLLENLCRMKPTLEDCGEILGVNTSTIEKWVKRTHKMSFSEFRNQKMAYTRHMIVRELLEQCKKGNMTALIWCSKNLCGWSDKTDQNINVSGTIEDIVKKYKE